MALSFLILSFLQLVAALSISLRGDRSPQCRSIPGDASWPTKSEWNALNQTVNGRLIATIPISAPCHRTLFNQSKNPYFDEKKCETLRNVWHFPETHLQSAHSPMAYQFTNDSCNPFQDPDTPCEIGFHVVYAINATSADQFRVAIQFATRHNIRLVIRNSGHDYLGKSTGAHALEIWTYSIKSLNLISDYRSEAYSGPAIKIGAGVSGIEAFTFAGQHGLMVVGGNCPTVGLAGGYSQGGGHGPLASKFGLGADQVLEWEVVTAGGEVLRANAKSQPDLYWALRGGGGSTYGVVLSMTVKAFPDTFVSTATLTAYRNNTNGDALYEGVGAFLKNLPAIVDSGATVVFVAAPFGFLLTPVTAPGIHAAELDRLLKPTLEKFRGLGLELSYSSRENPTFVSSYISLTGSWNVSDYHIGGRLIPRDLATNNTEALVKAIRYISERTLMSGVSFNVAKGVAAPDDVAVNPYFRRSLFSLTVGTPLDYIDWSANKAAQDQITYDLLPQLEKLTPNGGAYLNEADFQTPDFKSLLYGSHYDRLLQIKQKYDPKGIFYAKTAIGSDQWEQDPKGRLCRAVAFSGVRHL